MIELKREKHLEKNVNFNVVDSMFFDPKKQEINLFIVDIESENPQKTIKLSENNPAILINHPKNEKDITETIASDKKVSEYLLGLGIKNLEDLKKLSNEEEFLYMKINQESYDYKLLDAGWSRKEGRIAFEFDNKEDNVRDVVELYSTRDGTIQIKNHLWTELTKEVMSVKDTEALLESRGVETFSIMELYETQYPDESLGNFLKNMFSKNKKTNKRKL